MSLHSCCIYSSLSLSCTPCIPEGHLRTVFFSVFITDTAVSIRKNVGVHRCLFCRNKKELYCFMSQKFLWQLLHHINSVKLANWLCGKSFKSCIGWIWISSWLDVRYFCCRQHTLHLRCYLPMFGTLYHLKLSEE